MVLKKKKITFKVKTLVNVIPQLDLVLIPPKVVRRNKNPNHPSISYSRKDNR